MTTVKAVVRNGQIELEKPVDLPDGTVLIIPLPDLPGFNGSPDAYGLPEAAESWIRWYDALEPLEFTPEERAAWDEARQQQKDFELAQWEKNSQQIEKQFP
jgi:hypothetical protein